MQTKETQEFNYNPPDFTGSHSIGGSHSTRQETTEKERRRERKGKARKMGIVERIKEIEKELVHTQKNKATTTHIGMLKSQLSKLRTQLMMPTEGSGGVGREEG